MTGQDARPPRGRIEDLLRRIDKVARIEPGTEPGTQPDGGFELWIPRRLTLRDQTIPADVALMVLLDACLEKGYTPARFTEEDGGRLYLWERSEGGPAVG